MTNFAMIFPGQGSQSVGMLSALATTFPEVQSTFSEASEVLGYDLWQVVCIGPSEELNKTWKTQPALLAASVSIYQIWQRLKGPNPVVMAGHSLGEYSALVCAGVIDFKEAIALVELRGQLMQAAVPLNEGKMYAIIGLSRDAIVTICQQNAHGDVVAPVNFNSPEQTVIAGNKDAVERAAAACKNAGAKRALPLAVSVPSHCLLMKSAAQKLAQALVQIPFSVPKIPVLNNVNARIEREPEKIKQALVEQLYHPVCWTDIIEFLAKDRIQLLLEIGPGKVLTSLTKRISELLHSIAVNDPDSLRIALDAVK